MLFFFFFFFWGNSKILFHIQTFWNWYNLFASLCLDMGSISYVLASTHVNWVRWAKICTSRWVLFIPHYGCIADRCFKGEHYIFCCLFFTIVQYFSVFSLSVLCFLRLLFLFSPVLLHSGPFLEWIGSKKWVPKMRSTQIGTCKYFQKSWNIWRDFIYSKE